MSFLRRIWNVVKNPVRYVGRDLEGNKFYETKSLNDPTITKRTVQYSKTDDVWKYIGGGKQLPIQWSAWLTHTRKQPPTIEELQADMARQQRVQANVALIEARDRAEAEQMLAQRQQGTQQALADAVQAASAGSLGAPVPQAQTNPAVTQSGAVEEMPSHTTTTGSGSAPAEASASGNSKPRAAQAKELKEEKIKVLPPTFLTPKTSRKAKSSAPFALPNLSSEAEEQTGASSADEPKKKNAGPSPWRSKVVPETESWTPKARSRR